MKNQIDLSKAYAGQYITLRNGEKYRIGKIAKKGLKYYICSYCNELVAMYRYDGIDNDGETDFNIIAIEDSPEIKLIKKQSEVEGLEYALKYVSRASERSMLFGRIDTLKAEILILMAETL